MTMIGTVILVGIALFILSVAVVLLYMALMALMALMIMPPRPEPRRKIQRTLYEKDWPRIMEMTKLEKAGRKK